MKDNLTAQLELMNNKQQEIDKSAKLMLEQLEKISGLSANEAKEALMET